MAFRSMQKRWFTAIRAFITPAIGSSGFWRIMLCANPCLAGEIAGTTRRRKAFSGTWKMRLIYLAVPHLSRSERFLTIGSTITTMTVTSGSLQNYLQMNFTRTSLQAFILCQANRLCMMNRFWPDLWSHNNSHVFGISLCPWLWVHFTARDLGKTFL